MINRNFTFKVKTVSFENDYPVKFPTAGDLMDIEIKKALLSGTVYSGIIAAGTQISEHVLDSIDMQATLEVLCPDLIKDLPTDIKSLRGLDIIDSNQLIIQYKKQMLPWQAGWMKTLSEVPKKKDVKEETEEKAE